MVQARRIRDTIVSVFIPYWPGNPYQVELAKSLGLQGVRVEKGDSLKSVVHSMIFRGYRPDILHLHWLPLFEWRITSFLRLSLFVLRLFVVRFLGIKLVWTVHNLRPHESQCPKVDWLVRMLVARLANALITHTKSAKQQVVSTWRLRHSQKVSIIPHGNYIECYENKIDQTTARMELCIPNWKTVLLFLGGIRPYKGVLQLIDSFKLLEDSKTHLVIAGKPLNDEFSLAIKREIQGCNNITFIPGFVAEDKIQVYMNACDVVVFPYRDILSSGAVVLAMSFGRPCLAPRIGCITDILKDAEAFLYEPGKKGGLLCVMRYAIEKKAELRYMGEHNRKLAEQWGWYNIAGKTLQMYKRCLYRNCK